MQKQEYISASQDSGTSDGTTTSSYVNALDWKCDILTRKNISLKNTHATNDLKYQVLIRLGDMLANTEYDLKVGGVKVSDATSNGSGVITFPAYSGSFSEKIFTTELTPPVTFISQIIMI